MVGSRCQSWYSMIFFYFLFFFCCLFVWNHYSIRNLCCVVCLCVYSIDSTCCFFDMIFFCLAKIKMRFDNNKYRLVGGYNLSPDQRDDCFSPCEYKSVWWWCVWHHIWYMRIFFYFYFFDSFIGPRERAREFLSFDNKFHLLLFH